MLAIFAVIVVFATGPPAPLPTAPPVPNTHDTVRGAFHIHTTRSDGALDKKQVAAAAARSGVQFAIFTDHGNGVRPPDPPAYIDGVLCIDAVEISTNGGHYIAIDLPAAPYPLGGDADAVVEDVARLGGIGIAAHPLSPRPDLRWQDWTIPIDGLEWLNADSQWRHASRLRVSRALIDYLWRPAGALASLLERPVGTLAKWDELAATRPVIGLAGLDAHGGIGQETGTGGGRRLHVPSYDASFRTFSLYVSPDAPLTGNAADDAAFIVRAVREGRVFTAIDAIASPAALDFTATAGGKTVTAGGSLPGHSTPVVFSVRASAPARATTVLLRNGHAVSESGGGTLDHRTSLPGSYRVEVRVEGAPGTPPVPWLVSNAIVHGTDAPMSGRRGVEERVIPAVSLMERPWRVETSPGSTGKATAGEALSLTYRLASDVRASQFVALAADLPPLPAESTHLTFRGRSEQPMRVSVQLRYASDGAGRWGRSVYLDTLGREAIIPIAQLRPAGAAGPRPPLDRATSLLFVVDLVNAEPGAEGRFTLESIAVGREARELAKTP